MQLSGGDPGRRKKMIARYLLLQPNNGEREKKMRKILPLILACMFLLLGAEVKGNEGKIAEPVAMYTYRVVATYPHDPNAFTQGLLIDNGIMYEGTGINGRSSLRKVDLQTGTVEKLYDLPSIFFGEGITIFGDKLIQLTWKSKVGLVYDKEQFKLLKMFTYAGEGWGITNDGSSLIMGDGTSVIRFLDPESFEEKRRITVTDGQGAPVEALNELEYVKGLIYANIWQKDKIAIISPENGRVTAWLDLAGILPKEPARERYVDVLNGIAYDPAKDALYVTGKLWPKLFQIELVPAVDQKRP
jgi:glutaminyl-peptide cyclotransferase